MGGWRPLASEPDALKAALLDYLRDRAGLVYREATPSGGSLGQVTTIIADGRKLAIELSMLPDRKRDFSGRQALVFTISGQAADTRLGYRVDGEAVVDTETSCFLSLDVKVSSFERGDLRR
ncbi:hypothetical protein J5J10_22065 [Ciceribacter sp. L1K23]|uniref:hypothetical protein n=1 Tax=unclassified Ciceribacter TaxID=2628820 RepID=UPI001ABDB120|nr:MULTISPECIES: hypothetical protein [unclassified Ciceribacter]MBO3761704.1 hypothetical protein [Ciceribacter sp. L1K22]MBR0558390.1 hypothetical protein [Ciceribacter sp. L1K23]